MRQKKAKAIRREVNRQTVGAPLVEYDPHTGLVWSSRKGDGVTRRMAEYCTRKVYKDAKKRVKAMALGLT